MKRIELAVVAGLACCNNFAIAGNYTFRTWFEMPETVVAGEMFDVSFWVSLELSGQLVPTGPNVSWMSALIGSVEISGDLDSYSSISQLLPGLLPRSPLGTPDGAWLRDFGVFQDPRIPDPFQSVNYSNPIRVARVEVATVVDTRGILNIDLRPSELFGNVVTLQWWDAVANQPIIAHLDPDIEVISETGVIRVIPAPASIALLAPLAIVSTRRRRG